MRKLVLTQNTTVDGSVEMLEDWFDPQAQRGVDMTDVQEANQRHSDAADAVVLGRRTFEAFRDYWRDLDDDSTGIADYLNRVHKYVVASRLTEPEWEPTTVIDGGGDVITAVSDLKQQTGRDIVCTGSIELSHALIRAELIDELRLFVYPVVQGRGRRVFPDGVTPRLQHLDTTTFGSGIVLLTYTTAS